MKCIYCRDNRTDFTTREHFIPERLGHDHPFVLEKEQQAVCNDCQAWASRKIDPAIWQQVGAIAQFLHVFRIPGKEGRPKRMHDPGGIDYDPAGGRMSVKPASRPENAHVGDDLLLSRGLYKMALGALAWARSVEDARSPALDSIGFTRDARQTPFRPFARAHGRWVDEQVGLAVQIMGGDADLVVAIQLYGETLWAALGTDVERALRSLGHVPGVLVQWRAGEAPEHLNQLTMIATGLQDDGTVTVTIKPAPVREGDGYSTPAAMVASILAPTIQEIPTSGPAWVDKAAPPPFPSTGEWTTDPSWEPFVALAASRSDVSSGLATLGSIFTAKLVRRLPPLPLHPLAYDFTFRGARFGLLELGAAIVAFEPRGIGKRLINPADYVGTRAEMRAGLVLVAAGARVGQNPWAKALMAPTGSRHGRPEGSLPSRSSARS